MKKTFIFLAVFVPVLCLPVLGAGGGVPATSVLSVPADYSTIEAAIQAAQGPTIIQIAPGDYYEQLLISNKINLTLSGEAGTVLHARADLARTFRPRTNVRAVVGIIQSAAVVLVGLTIDGDQQGGAYSDGELQGVFYLSSSGQIESCALRGFRGISLDDYSNARALAVWNPKSAGGSEIGINIISNRFENNEASIAISGDDRDNPTELRTTFNVEGNSIKGPGPAPMAVDGVAIYTGASGIFRGNTIADHRYTGTGDPYASGIDAFDGLGISRNPARFVPLQPLRFEGNVFRNNDDHLVLLNAPGSKVANNVFENTASSSPRWGALAISGNGVAVSNNDFAGIPTGIVLLGNDPFFPSWPLIPAALNSVLENNRFCDVAQITVIGNGAKGVQQRGSMTCPFRPTISALSPPGLLIVRDWHGQRIILEYSFNLADWTAALTNSMDLPTLRFEDATSSGQARRFYRAVRL